MLHHQMEYSITNFHKARLRKQACPTRLGVLAIMDQVSWPDYMTCKVSENTSTWQVTISCIALTTKHSKLTK